MLTVAINSVPNMKEHLAEVTSCDSKNLWCLDRSERRRYGACVCRTSHGRARGNWAMIFRYGEPRGIFGVGCSQVGLFFPLNCSSF